LVGMGRKKLSETDRHKTPRKPVQFPVDWIKVAHEEAKKRPTPAMWLLVELLHEYAKKNDGYKGTLEQWRLTAKRAGAPGGTTIVMPGDKKYAEKRMEGRANSMADLEKTAESAFKSNLALDRFVAASPNGASGAVQPIYTATENFLSSFGYTSDNLKSVALMEQAIGDILGSKMAELGARGLTDKDMEVLRQALPHVEAGLDSRSYSPPSSCRHSAVAESVRGLIRRYFRLRYPLEWLPCKRIEHPILLRIVVLLYGIPYTA